MFRQNSRSLPSFLGFLAPDSLWPVSKSCQLAPTAQPSPVPLPLSFTSSHPRLPHWTLSLLLLSLLPFRCHPLPFTHVLARPFKNTSQIMPLHPSQGHSLPWLAPAPCPPAPAPSHTPSAACTLACSRVLKTAKLRSAPGPLLFTLPAMLCF